MNKNYNCTPLLDKYVYLSDEYENDFGLSHGAKLSEVISVRKYMQMDVKGYAIGQSANAVSRSIYLL